MNKRFQSIVNSAKPLIKDSIWMSSRQFAITLIGLAFTIAFARMASKETYGQYQLVLSILATVSIFSISGLNTSVLQAVARGFDGVYQKAIRISFKWSVILGTPTLIGLGIFYLIKNQPEIGFSLLIASLFFPALYATNTWEYFIQGKGKFDILAKYSVFRAILNTGLLITALLIFRDNIILLLLVYFTSISFANYFFYQKTKRFIKNKNEDKETIKYGWFLTKITALNSVFSKIDYLLVGHFLGMESLAVYSVGIAFGTKIKDMFKAIFSILSPRIARQGFDKKANYIFVFVIFSIFAVILYFLMPFAIRLLFSDKYVESIKIAQIFILFLPLSMTNLLAENHLSFFCKNKKVILITNTLSPLIKFALMIFAIKLFRAEGLAAVNGFYPAIRTIMIFLGFRL